MAKQRKAENIANVKHVIPYNTYVGLVKTSAKLKRSAFPHWLKDAARCADKVFADSRGIKARHFNLLEFSDETLHGFSILMMSARLGSLPTDARKIA